MNINLVKAIVGIIATLNFGQFSICQGEEVKETLGIGSCGIGCFKLAVVVEEQAAVDVFLPLNVHDVDEYNHACLEVTS